MREQDLVELCRDTDRLGSEPPLAGVDIGALISAGRRRQHRTWALRASGAVAVAVVVALGFATVTAPRLVRWPTAPAGSVRDLKSIWPKELKSRFTVGPLPAGLSRPSLSYRLDRQVLTATSAAMGFQLQATVYAKDAPAGRNVRLGSERSGDIGGRPAYVRSVGGQPYEVVWEIRRGQWAEVANRVSTNDSWRNDEGVLRAVAAVIRAEDAPIRMPFSVRTPLPDLYVGSVEIGISGDRSTDTAS
ncbi:MAG: hypothetical protein QOJ50_3286, partial [Cryptosporangiaceae bacterium]|nr:hypothetical protein [Cryptosporangiaceae bacterium]